MPRSYDIRMVLLFAASLFGAHLLGQNSATQGVLRAARVLQSVLRPIPEQILSDSVCVLVVPRVASGISEFDVPGVMSCRGQVTKSWSSPAGIRVWGTSLPSLLKDHDLVLLVMNRKSADSIISGKMFHSDLRVALGPISGKGNHGVSYNISADILAYSRPATHISTASLKSASVNEDLDANQKIYGWRLENHSILDGLVQAPRVALPFMRALVPCWTDTSSTSRAARIRQGPCPIDPKIDFPK